MRKNTYKRINYETRGMKKSGRKEREWYPGAIYHLMERGIRRQEIFREETDYYIFIAILKNVMEKYGANLHAYCLMTNHIHLLLETYEEKVGKIMQKLAGDYARTFNRRYGYKGHLFEDRYKSCLVETDEYFLQTSRYIHLNPVKARMVSNPEDYKWSSYRRIINLCDDGITTSQKTLSYFGNKSIWGYREFVEDIANKYVVTETEIRTVMGEDELWLPW